MTEGRRLAISDSPRDKRGITVEKAAAGTESVDTAKEVDATTIPVSPRDKCGITVGKAAADEGAEKEVVMGAGVRDDCAT
jgi:hypothetical protein